MNERSSLGWSKKMRLSPDCSIKDGFRMLYQSLHASDMSCHQAIENKLMSNLPSTSIHAPNLSLLKGKLNLNLTSNHNSNKSMSKNDKDTSPSTGSGSFLIHT